MAHLSYTFLVAALTAGASALPGQRSGRERLCSAVYVGGGSLALIFTAAWVMYFIHR